jgi:hypothetical protein
MNRITHEFALTVILALSLLTVDILAQSEEQMDQLRQERENYFNEQLELTAKEADAFWPVYNDYDNRKTKISEEERNAMRYSRENADNLSEKEIGEILDKIQRLRGELDHLEQEYYGKRFQEVLPQRKVLKLYWVEWDFRRHLIRKIRGHGPGGEGPRGNGPGSDRPRGNGPGGGWGNGFAPWYPSSLPPASNP